MATKGISLLVEEETLEEPSEQESWAIEESKRRWDDVKAGDTQLISHQLIKAKFLNRP